MIACCISASVAVGFDLVVRDVACLVCHRRFDGEDNPWDLVARPWVGECALWNSPLNCKPNVRLRCLFCALPSSSGGFGGVRGQIDDQISMALSAAKAARDLLPGDNPISREKAGAALEAAIAALLKASNNYRL